MELNEDSIHNEYDKILEGNYGIVKQNFNDCQTSIKIIYPSIETGKALTRELALLDKECEYKRLLFRVLNAINYAHENDEGIPKSTIYGFANSGVQFMDFLNSTVVKNKYSILKDFESHRVSLGLKPQSTTYNVYINLIKHVLSFDWFIKALSQDQLDYLYELKKIKAMRFINDVRQVNLCEFFQEYTWLRDEKRGVGNEVYKRFASPKLVINAANITFGTILIQLNQAKHTIIDWMENEQITKNDISANNLKLSYNHANQINKVKGPVFQKWWDCFFSRFVEKANLEDERYKLALEVIVGAVSVNPINYQKVICDVMNKHKRYYEGHNFLFSLRTYDQFSIDPCFIDTLIEYVSNGKKGPVPLCGAEKTFFAYLMAAKAVQPKDIFRLKEENFRFLKRRSGKVESIECEYFKSRANDYHVTPSMKASEIDGKATLTILNDITCNFTFRNRSSIVGDDKFLPRGFGFQSSFGKLINNLIYSNINNSLNENLTKYKSSRVIVDSLNKLFLSDEIKSERRLFTLSHIKNCSVHARSDLFNPASLVNYNSHKSNTERQNYLNEHNQEWLNNCGRITRAVMHDLQYNVFSTDNDKLEFNTEFTHATEYIDNRRDEIIARLRMVAGSKRGNITEVGLANNIELSNEAAPDTIYIINNPESVLRIKHYLSEVQKYNTRISKNSPDYFFYEILPTVEWMSEILNSNYFDIVTLKMGDKLYEEFKNDLPGLFKAHLGH
jgi:hypothetical protein